MFRYMRFENWIIIITSIFIFSFYTQVNAQCSWLYEDREPGSYVLEDNNTILFYCENFMDTIYAPEEYVDVYWQYTTDTGLE